MFLSFLFLLNFFPQITVSRICKLYNLGFFSHQQNYRLYIRIKIYISCILRLLVVIWTCSVKDHELFPFQNLQVKMAKSYFSNVWVKMVKKVLHTSPSTFNHFTSNLQGVVLGCLLLWVLFIFIWRFFKSVFKLSMLIVLGWVVSYWIF